MHKTTYWIKLYHEIITDPKMGLLDDHTWRRTIELFLIAGDHNQGGLLPSTHDLAWILHTTEEDILTVLQLLAQLDIVDQQDQGRWRIINFSKRQGPASSSERSLAYRERKNPRSLFATNPREKRAPCRDAAELDTDSESDRDEDSESERESPTQSQKYFASAFQVQPNKVQLLTLAQLEKTHGFRRLSQVIDWAVSSGIPPGRALKSICTAITSWTELKTPPDPRRSRRTGAIAKIRKEYSNGHSP